MFAEEFFKGEQGVTQRLPTVAQTSLTQLVSIILTFGVGKNGGNFEKELLRAV